MPAKTKKRSYTCKKCGRKMKSGGAHRAGCPGLPSGVDTTGLAEAALDAVKAQMKDERNRREKAMKLVKQALDILEG